MKKQFLILFAFISVLTFGQVPQRFNKVIVTGDITSPKFIKTGSNADSVLLGNGSARAISAIKTDTVSLSNRINAKATGSGTANGTNTGDETLTSIKTKLGAATSVSDGYLKYQDWNIFNSKEPAFSKNTAFNKNFGTTPGTVLEGRTFGTAANSAVGDFIQNQNSSAQTANMWINGAGVFGGSAASINAISTINTNNSTLSLGNAVGFTGTGAEGARLYYSGSTGNTFLDSYYSNGKIYFRTNVSSGNPVNALIINNVGAATFNSSITASSFYGNGSNLTGIQLPITLTTNGTSGAATFIGNVLNVPNYTQSATGSSYSCTFTNILNTSLALGLMSDYTTVGGVISIAIHGGVSSTGSGKCTFRLSLPAAASPSYKFVVTASDTSKTTGRNIFVEATASNYVDVSFLATAAGEIIEFTIMGNGHQ